MEIYCLKCKIKTESLNLNEVMTKNNRKQIKAQCKICNTNKSQFILNFELKKGGGGNTSQIEKMYYDPKAGYCGINELQRKTGKSQKEVKKFLNQQETYTLHKPARKNFNRERVYVHDIEEQWQADLVEMIPYSEENNDFKYLLTVIDCFSKFAWAVPIKNKSGNETLRVFEKLFKDRKPLKLQTDKGKEFYNTPLNKLFKSNKINHFSTDSDLKAQIVERFNRTLKEKMWKIFTQNGDNKWIDIIDDLLTNYNNSYHRSIKMTPTNASKKENREIVHKNLYPEKICELDKNKFKIGDNVRITKYKSIFDKGYLPNWSSETFVINKVFKNNPCSYELKDLDDELIKGKFYNEELTLFDKQNKDYIVEKILKKRTRNGIKEVLIKWYGYPEKFNSWEVESENLKK